jgi:hypothetical protein
MNVLIVATRKTRAVVVELFKPLDLHLTFSDEPIEALRIAEDKSQPFDLLLFDVEHAETLEAIQYARFLDSYSMIYLLSLNEDERAQFNLQKQALELRILIRGLIEELK